MKIAINIDYGGASLSDEALGRLEELGSTIQVEPNTGKILGPQEEKEKNENT